MTNSPEPPVRFAVVGLNHSHIYMQVECMQTAGGHLVAYYSAEDDLAAPFGVTRFPLHLASLRTLPAHRRFSPAWNATSTRTI